MHAAVLCHTGVVGEFTMLRLAVSSTTELVFGRSPVETSLVEVMNEVSAKVRGLEELCSWLEGHGMRIWSLLLGPPPGQVCWADRLEEAAGRLEAALAERRQVDAELEALRTSATLVWDVILGEAGGPSSLATSLSMVAEEVENWINTTVANGVRWGTRSALVVALSHFPELESELELLGSERDADLRNDQADALWPLVSASSNSLASLIPSSFAHDPPDDTEE
jgi:hypothetical protein